MGNTIGYRFLYICTAALFLERGVSFSTLITSSRSSRKSHSTLTALPCACATSDCHHDPPQPQAAGGAIQSRRHFTEQIIIGSTGAAATAWVGTISTPPTPAFAAATATRTVDAANGDDSARLRQGLERLNYLLENWEKETTVCGNFDNPYTGSKGCERTPLKVMEYMGYKSMNDPLFKADKTMRRLERLIPSDKESDYLEAIEKWSEAAEEASGMAYVSSWGEANPGGGKDRVEYFIERAKKNVQDARDSLVTVISILKI